MTGVVVILGVAFLATLAYLAVREKEWSEERERLIQRIAQPEAAAAEYYVRQSERKPVPTLPYDDDSALRAVKEQRKMNDGVH